MQTDAADCLKMTTELRYDGPSFFSVALDCAECLSADPWNRQNVGFC